MGRQWAAVGLACLGAGALLVVARELWFSLGPRRWRRQQLWRMARARATELGRPLLVVGDPDGGVVNAVVGRDYGCGDVCLDLSGCPRCPHGLRGRAEDLLPTLPSDSFVVYVSCTLEYVDDAALVGHELHRVSGGELFVAHVEPVSLTAYFYPGAQRRILRAPPVSREVVYA
jgi:hypothetical protein